MKLQPANIYDINVFTGYGDGYVMVNKERYDRNLLVMPDRILTDWQPAGFEDLCEAHFRAIAALGPEIVLLGTGSRLRFPRPELTRPLMEARIGLEVMDVQAACRTYNFLAGEGRKVAAALLVS